MYTTISAEKRCSFRLYCHLFRWGYMYNTCYLYLLTNTGVQARYQYQMMSVSLISNTTGVTCVSGTANPSC